MISNSPGSRNPAGHAGLARNVAALANALADFFQARLALVAEESKAAALHVLVMAGCLLFAAALCVTGYVFLITGAVVALAHLVGVSWPFIAVAIAGAHFLAALILLLVARNRITKPFFSATAAELKKDREWLRNLDATTDQSTN